MASRKELPLISVVICTYNRADLLAALLQTVCNQMSTACAYEIIIVDNNSSDTTPLVGQEFAARYPHVRYCVETNQGHSHARNRGWQEAKGEYVAYLDDDCKAPPHWLRTADEIIRTVAPMVFGGPYLATYHSSKPAWFKDEYGSYIPCRTATFINETPDLLHGGNLFIARRLLAQIGGFDVSLGMSGHKRGYGDETELLRYLHTTLPATTFYYDPALWVYHLVRPEKMQLGWLLRDRFIQGRNIHQVYGATNRSWLVLIGQSAIVGALCLVDGCLLALIRRRASFPRLQNYWYESTLPRVKTLGKFYQQLSQKMQHSQKKRSDVNEALQ